MRVSPLGVTVLVAWGCLAPASVVSAQSIGNIAGTVSDGSGGVVPGAIVTARNQGTAAVREVLTDGSGRYALPLLPIGNYTVTVAMSRLPDRREDRRDAGSPAEPHARLRPAGLLDQHRGDGLEQVAEVALQRIRRLARPVDQRPAGSRAAAERTQLRAARAARPRHRDRAARAASSPRGPAARSRTAAACRCRRRACARTPTTGSTTASTTTS